MFGNKAPTCAKYKHNGDKDAKMDGHTRKNKIKDEVICNKVGVVPSEN